MRELEEYAKINKIPIMQKDGILYLIEYIKNNNIKSILEIGTAIGYSAIMMASINSDIKITTIEKDKERFEIAISNIKKYNLEKQINVIYGDATDIIIEDKYDLIFIDAAKGKNIYFFEKYKNNLNIDGTIITDNLSFHGLVEDKNLIMTKNQQGIVNKIKSFISFLNSNSEFNTKYVEVGDTIAISKRRENITNLVVVPNKKNEILKILNKNIKGIILGVKSLSIYPLELEIEEIIDIKNKTDKKVLVALNKMIHNEDLSLIREILSKIKESDIDGIIFYDLGVFNIIKEMNIDKELIISMEHLNASIDSNNFYYKRGINSSIVTSDITFNDIIDIKNNTKMNIYYTVFGYLPIFYSRRYLLTSYFEYINEKMDSDLYYIYNDDLEYMIREYDYGTIIYSPLINLISEIDKLNELDNLIIDLSYIDDSGVIDNYLSKECFGSDYRGFYDKKTIYKLRGDNNE